MIDQSIQYFENLHPALFLLGLALCPLLPIPVSPLWVLAGMRFGPMGGILISILGLVINLTTAYLLSKYWFRRQIEWFLRKWNVKVPVVAEAEQKKFTLLVRIVPGNPLVVQNYLLGVVGVRFSVYFAVGLAVQLFYAIGFNLFGEAVFEGRFGLMLFAVLLVVSVALAVKLLAKRFFPKNNLDDPSNLVGQKK
jgi:uncharacterized membrane protein YdjX (TVP38/TMEM64 family)